MSECSFRSYGKVNLYLDVLERRPDGFTNIETVLQSIDLWDGLCVWDGAEGIHLTCSEPSLGCGPENLVYRAAALLKASAGVQQGVSIHLEKNLPIAAGLAGGSSNAAATLIALSALWDLGLATEQLCELGAQLGSDVPFCVMGGTVAATGRGEILESLPPLAPRWLVLAHPPLAVTAGHAYGHPGLTRNLEALVGGKTPSFRAALKNLERGAPEQVIFNRMESGIFLDHPELAALKEELIALGCTASAMSGSGPTVFGLCEDEASARRVAESVTAVPTTVVRTINCGVART